MSKKLYNTHQERLEATRRLNRESYARHREKRSEEKRKYRDTHLEQSRASNKKSRKKRLKKNSNYERDYHNKHKKERQESSQKSYQKHRDQRLQDRKRYRETNTIKVKESKEKSRLKKIYNLTLTQYNELKRKQNNCCTICGKKSKRRLSVDHNHKTGKIRGLLCHKCNAALGFFDEDINVLKNAIKYLRKHNR
jgi:hypothetical protein